MRSGENVKEGLERLLSRNMSKSGRSLKSKVSFFAGMDD